MFFYMIMPVGADPQFADKKSILLRAAKKHGMSVHFPFETSNESTFDIDKTLSVLTDADFVIADLSKERPSCYFELGLAQAQRKDVYLIAKEGTDIHQAHGRRLTRFYESLEDYGQIVSQVLKEANRVTPVVRLRA
jgi:nucleoside 2-deoxyribosyltransferase